MRIPFCWRRATITLRSAAIFVKELGGLASPNAEVPHAEAPDAVLGAPNDKRNC